MSDSESDQGPIEQALHARKEMELERKREQSKRQKEEQQQRKEEKAKLRAKIMLAKQEKQGKAANLFDDEPVVEQSSNTQSHFTNKQQDDSFQRNLREKLPEKVIKSLRMPAIADTTSINILNKSKKIIKQFDNVTVETLDRCIDHKQNQVKSLEFLHKHLFDRHLKNRQSLCKIVKKSR